MENSTSKVVVTERYYASYKVGGVYKTTERRATWQQVYNDVFQLHNKAAQFFSVTFCVERSMRTAQQ